MGKIASWFNRIRGKAGEADADEMEDEFDRILGPGEHVAAAYKLVRDVFLFTNWRLLFIDKQGLSGNKVEYRSIPYPSIRQFSIETAGALDTDAELTLWLAGSQRPIIEEFGKQVDIYELQSTLALGVYGSSREELEPEPMAAEEEPLAFEEEPEPDP